MENMHLVCDGWALGWFVHRWTERKPHCLNEQNKEDEKRECTHVFEEEYTANEDNQGRIV